MAFILPAEALVIVLISLFIWSLILLLWALASLDRQKKLQRMGMVLHLPFKKAFLAQHRRLEGLFNKKSYAEVREDVLWSFLRLHRGTRFKVQYGLPPWVPQEKVKKTPLLEVRGRSRSHSKALKSGSEKYNAVFSTGGQYAWWLADDWVQERLLKLWKMAEFELVVYPPEKGRGDIVFKTTKRFVADPVFGYNVLELLCRLVDNFKNLPKDRDMTLPKDSLREHLAKTAYKPPKGWKHERDTWAIPKDRAVAIPKELRESLSKPRRRKKSKN